MASDPARQQLGPVATSSPKGGKEDGLEHDLNLAGRCLRGEKGAAETLREQCHLKLAGLLVMRGASALEAEGVLDEFWQDTFKPGVQGEPPLLAKYSRASSLLSWLSVFVTSRFLDLKQSGKPRGAGAPGEEVSAGRQQPVVKCGIHFPEEMCLANRCLLGEEGAVEALRERCHEKLLRKLISRGAQLAVAEEILADFWPDTFLPKRNDAPPLLAKYKGESPLLPYLTRAATNRLIDYMRRQELWADRPPDEAWCQALQVDVSAAPEDSLLELVRQALEKGFEVCAPQDLVRLRLVHGHGVTQRQIAAIWHCSEFVVCRRLGAAMANIRKAALAHIRQADPWLELTWEDILETCSSPNPGGATDQAAAQEEKA
ncbi:MAG: hypothetical protein ABSH34_05280 [Verrucomicrobiota bacterium]